MKIGIGEWKMRNGMKATIAAYRPGSQYQWIGWIDGSPYAQTWNDDGRELCEGKSDRDLISPWASSIATGHNPDKLTEEQVGNGFRVPDWNEIENLSGEKKQKALEYWQASLEAWIQPDSCGCCMTGTYRTRLSREELAALDKLKKRLIRVEELPAVCWVMEGSSMSNQYLLSYRNNSSNHIGIGGELAHHLSYYKDKNFQWSSDLKNWNSFEVEDK